MSEALTPYEKELVSYATELALEAGRELGREELRGKLERVESASRKAYRDSLERQMKAQTKLYAKLVRKFSPNSYTAEIQWDYIERVEAKIEELEELLEEEA